MIELKNKYVIGAHIMFYEVEMFPECVQSWLNALSGVENTENVIIDLCFNFSEYLETIDTDVISKDDIKRKFLAQVENLRTTGASVRYDFYENDEYFYNIGPYRRDLNYKFCDIVDFVIWGESDCLLPEETFDVIETVSNYAQSQNINKYCLTFGTRKMWDPSWKDLEHNDFTDCEYKEMHDNNWQDDPSSIWYTMSNEEMNEVNKKTENEQLDIRFLNTPRFDGSGLVISSQLLQSGINIPHATWLCGEDTAFQNMITKVMGNTYIQFVIKNVLKVHNRVHPLKREYVKGESHLPNVKEKRKSNNLHTQIQQMMHHNLNNLFSTQTKFFERKDADEVKNGKG